jgi:hypothetical protein
VDLFYIGKWDDNYCSSFIVGRIFIVHGCCTSIVVIIERQTVS